MLSGILTRLVSSRHGVLAAVGAALLLAVAAQTLRLAAARGDLARARGGVAILEANVAGLKTALAASMEDQDTKARALAALEMRVRDAQRIGARQARLAEESCRELLAARLATVNATEEIVHDTSGVVRHLNALLQ